MEDSKIFGGGMDVAVMVEGQNGLTWERWQRIARVAEDGGFAGLFRSDHFTNSQPPDMESLELWVSLTWLAAHTRRIEFGPLVTPFSFRHPALTARMGAAVDDLSGGRLILGLGAGWQEREHHIFGFDLLDMQGRFARFEEGLECVTQLLQSDGPVTFQGDHFRLDGAQVLPRPQRRGGPRILVGGNGMRQTLPLVARYASEWNANFIGPEEFRRLNTRLDELLIEQGRPADSVRRSLMTGCVFGKDQKALDAKLAKRGRTRDELLGRGIVVGAGDEIGPQLRAYADAGVQRVMLQWLDLDDIEGLEEMGKVVL
ncbi:MAG: LLM class F420-dependent oxidoreductase [Anaerolineae bacterium]